MIFTVKQAFETVLGVLCKEIYVFLGFIYQIFFNVAEADIFGTGAILDFYKRVQLIIGVYMVFQLALIIMRGIFNVEEVSDKNNNEFIKKVIIALTMLAVLTPISIPNASNSYEKRINNNGLLFGILYDLQYRLLDQNTLGQLVLGKDDKTFASNDDETKESSRSTAANEFATTVLRGFISINLTDAKDKEGIKTDENLEENPSNWECSDITDVEMEKYTGKDSTPADLTSLVAEKCSSKKEFKFEFHGLFALAAGIFLVILMFSFCIDVAVRAIKLAFLRLIAPIPIISYMDPKGSKDSGFNSWVKTLTKTYLDLFIRIIIIYFIMYLIHDFINTGIYINHGTGIIGRISFVLIFIGLFVFAKEAPKFFQQALGLKEEPGNIFGTTFGRIGKAAGIGAAAAGAIGSFNASRLASLKADETNKGSQKWSDQVGFKEHAGNVLNKGKHLMAGMVGMAGGAATGFKAAATAKDHNVSAVRQAQYQRNQADITRGRNGSTFLGRQFTNAQRAIMGQDKYDKKTGEMNVAKARGNAADDLYKYLAGKGSLDGAKYKVDTEYKYFDENGKEQTRKISGVSYDEFKTAWEQAKVERRSNPTKTTFEMVDKSGVTHTFGIDAAETGKALDEISYSAGDYWASIEQDKWDKNQRKPDGSEDWDKGYQQKKEDYEYLGGKYDGAENNVHKVKIDSKKSGGKATHIERSKEYNRAKADHGAVDKK